MSKFQVGYAEVNINPPLGAGVSGYYIPRYGKGFLDDLMSEVMVFSCGGKKIALISVDVCGFAASVLKEVKKGIAEKTDIPESNIFLSATHTHTGALLVPTEAFEADEEVIRTYAEFVTNRIVDGTVMALADLKDAKMGFIVGYAPERVAYIRRYKMKDGSTFTCPPIGDPNIDHPIGELDQRVNVLRFDREGGHSIVLVNYGLHADTVNGEMFSSDWPGWMRRTVEKVLDGTKCMFYAGAQGDVGSTHVFPEGGDMNDTEISFDNEMKSPGMARFVGRALAGTVLQVYDKVEYIDVDSIDLMEKVIPIPSNMPTKEELPLAHKYKELHDAGRDDEIPFKAMQLTTVVAEALRMVRLENGPENYMLNLTALRLGDVVMLGIPGEPFTEIGVKIKETEGYRMILPCALTNGDMGYFPVQSAYDEGGYEAKTSPFKAGVAERIIEGAKELLSDIR
ncbi:MAG: hypothetical protein IJN74_02530 [Clostridia bacterium]|nr:hypothetical protein [Clostridia bacterium]